MSELSAESRRHWLSLIVICVGFLMIVLDQTIVNVALPAIQDDLGFSQSSLAWVVNSYLIAFGGLLLLAGRLGDLIGRKRVFLSGLVGFTVASMICGASQSQEMLIIARFVQGACGAVTSAVVLGMIVTMFREPKEQARAIGIYSFVATAGAAIGLLAGGVLTQALNWHWIFFVNVPIGIVTGWFGLRLLEDDEGIGFAQGADVIGALLMVSPLMLAVYTIVEVEKYGWLSTHTLGLGAVSVLLAAAFVIRQAKVANPLVPLRIFKHRNLSGANVVQILSVAGMFGMFFLGSLYLQKVLMYDTTQVGLAFLPTTVMMAVLSLNVTAKLIHRFGAKNLLVPGITLVTLGLILFGRMPVDGNYWLDVFPSMVVLGTGAGLAFPALMTVAMTGIDPHDSGLASGLVNTAAQVGGAIGLAVLATLSTTKANDHLASGESLQLALVSGYRYALVVAGVLSVVAVISSIVIFRKTPTVAADADDSQERELAHVGHGGL